MRFTKKTFYRVVDKYGNKVHVDETLRGAETIKDNYEKDFNKNGDEPFFIEKYRA